MITNKRQMDCITSSINTKGIKAFNVYNQSQYYVTMHYKSAQYIYNVVASLLQIGVTSALIYASLERKKVNVFLNKPKEVNYTSMPTILQSFALR